MSKKLGWYLGVLGFSLTLVSHAAQHPAPGQKLSEEQIAQLGQLAVYQIGENQIRVIGTETVGKGATLVINAQGVVGSSRNEISISGVPSEQIQAKLRQVNPQPTSMQSYEPTGITVARYSNFELAVQGLQAIKAALPTAEVRLPVRFAKQIPH